MEIYHCSPVAGLKILEPRQPESFQKPPRVYMTKLYPMALFYGVRNFEYTYGYTREGQLYFSEYFPNALAALYKGKAASVYLCRPEEQEESQIPNEILSSKPVPILEERRISDLYEALLEQERLGQLRIHPYETLSPQALDWIFRTQKDIILKRGYLTEDGPGAEYAKLHYPASWAAAQEEYLRSADASSPKP